MKRILYSTVLQFTLAALPVFLVPSAVEAQTPWGNVRVERAPSSFSYTVEEVYFKRPQTYKTVASKIDKAMVAVKVTIYGRRFRDMNTGPVVWLNRIRANIVRVSLDGTIAEAYFYRPFSDFTKAVRELRGWELIFAQNFGADVLRIGPKGRRSEKEKEFVAPPPIRRLTDEEWKHALELAAQYKVGMPPRSP